MKALLILLILIAVALSRPVVEISTCGELVHHANRNPFGRFVLKNSLDCGEYRKTLIPVFRGSLDGKGHTIRNVNIRCSSQYYCGFFGEGEGARVSNLNLDNFQVQGELNMGTGGLFGALSFSYLTNVNLGVCGGVRNEISNGGFTVGGLVGLARNSVIHKCSVRQTLVSGAISGGIVGSISTFDVIYTPFAQAGREEGDEAEEKKRGNPSPTVIVSKISETYNYGFSSDEEATIVSASPSGLVTTVFGYISQIVYDPTQQESTPAKKEEQGASTLGRRDVSKKFILPPVNYLGETWAGGIAGLAFGTNLFRVGVFRGTVFASRNGLINDQLSFVRVAAGGVVGAYDRTPDKSFFVSLSFGGFFSVGINIGPISLNPSSGGITVGIPGSPNQFDYPATVTAEQVFAESGVKVFGVDGALVGGVFGVVGDLVIPIEIGFKKQDAKLADGHFPATIFIKDSYSKAELLVSGTSQSFPATVGGFIGFETSGYTNVNLVNVVSSARLHTFPSPAPEHLDVFGETINLAPSIKKQARDVTNSNVFFDNKINEGVPQVTANEVAVGLAPYPLIDAIKLFPGFGTLWKVTDKDYKPNYFFKFLKNLPIACPNGSEYKPQQEKPQEYKPQQEYHK